MLINNIKAAIHISGSPLLFFIDMDKVKGLFWGLAICVIITLPAGCGTTRYVPVETVRTDSVYADRWHKDSVFVHDSVFMNRWTQGDTVFTDKYVVKYAYRDKVRYDTVAVVRQDTVSVPCPVEKELGWWERVRIDAFPVLVIIIAVLAVVVVWLARKLKGK